MHLMYSWINIAIVRLNKSLYMFHLAWSMGRSRCYVNKEYNLGILKEIILFLICLQSFPFPINNGNKGLHTFRQYALL